MVWFFCARYFFSPKESELFILPANSIEVDPFLGF